MKEIIEKKLPNHIIVKSDSDNIYIADYKNKNNGSVTLLENEPDDINFVYLQNSNRVAIYFDGFKDNALILDDGTHSQQCECILFPSSCNETDWVLFIECKYVKDLKAATDVKNGYPKKMLSQIIDTVKFFRDKGILKENRRATAIVAFPNLLREFNSVIFSGYITDISIEHNILIRPTDSAIIKSSKTIKPLLD